ncbi:hypothetical protein [Stenotrophomonas maltophilia]|uniref:hypothetical protein n=1 Tax=Stenotrophomonas maltophilia TaxID=40324 RepID=UPI0015C5723F|nr:hypothetical protein [Stenotrophomonas maltophilia]
MSGNKFDADPQSMSEARKSVERERAKLHSALNRQNRNYRLYQAVTVTAFAAVVVSTLVATYSEIIKENIGFLDWLRSASPASLVAAITASATALVGVVFAAYTRLDASSQEQTQRAVLSRVSFSRYEDDSFGSPDVAGQDSSATPGRNSPSTVASRGPTHDEISEIASRVTAELASRSTEADSLKRIRTLYETAQERLNAAITALNERALLNLLIGSVVTVAAAFTLIYIVVSDPLREVILVTGAARTLSWTSLAAHYVPRLSIVIFLEVFAFFFLRLYRNTLAEVRLYQIDLTRVSTQAVAVELVFTSGDGAQRAATAAALINAQWSGAGATDSTGQGIDPKLVGELASIAAKMANKTA